MQNLFFKNKGAYLEWRAHWRRNYKNLSLVIHQLKRDSRRATNNAEQQSALQSELAAYVPLARSHMMARHAVDAFYQQWRTAK